MIALTKNMSNYQLKLHSNLADATFKIVDEIFSSFCENFNLISFESFKPVVTVNDFKEIFLRKVSCSEKFTVRHDSSKITPIAKGRKKRCNIFPIQTFKEFRKVYNQLSPEIFRFSGFYLIIFINGEIPEIHEIFKLMWKIQIFNVNVMFEDKSEEVQVQTFIPFNTNKCNDTTPKLINRFKNGKFKNGIENIFSSKMKNLHNCPIRVSISNNTDPFVFARRMKNGSYELSGDNINILTAFAKFLNFKLNFSYIGNEGFFFENGTSEGPLKALLDKNADLTINNWWLKKHRLKFFDATIPYITEKYIMIVPPGKELTAFEKLVYPFSFPLWIMIGSCLLVGIIVIAVIKREPMNIQNFVFGTGIRSPYLNLFIAFIGGAQHLLPKRNFARFLLMLFLMFSLIIRTLYQGSFYQLLKSNKAHKEVQSIQEIIQKNFSLYFTAGAEDLIEFTGIRKER